MLVLLFQALIAPKEMTAIGQSTFDKVFQYRISSFNTVQTPVNEATSLLDLYEIRNMRPSRTLTPINGKRKNLSSLLYVQTSLGQGEKGAAISGHKLMLSKASRFCAMEHFLNRVLIR